MMARQWNWNYEKLLDSQSPHEFLYVCSPKSLQISWGNTSISLRVDSVELHQLVISGHGSCYHNSNNCFPFSFERVLDYSYCSLGPPSSVHHEPCIGLNPVKDIAFFLIPLPHSSQTRRERKAKNKLIPYRKSVTKN